MGEATIRRAKALLRDVGLVHLRRTGNNSVVEMSRVASRIMGATTVYTGGANPRDSLGSPGVNVYDVGVPGGVEVRYHHEMAYVSKSVTSLSLLCVSALTNGGHTYFADNTETTKHLLRTPLGGKLLSLGVIYVRGLTDKRHRTSSPMYNHWQDSFNVTTREDAEAVARTRNLTFSWGTGNYFRTQHRAHAFEYFPHGDSDVLFTSVADDGIWFDTWPGMSALPSMGNVDEATPNDRPLKMLWGDGSEFSRTELVHFANVYSKFGTRIEWTPGDIVVFCNYRFAHGRPAYTADQGEERILRVVLGPTLERVGQRTFRIE